MLAEDKTVNDSHDIAFVVKVFFLETLQDCCLDKTLLVETFFVS